MASHSDPTTASSSSSGIVLIDSSPDSLTVSWPEPQATATATVRYVLQYCQATNDKNDNTFETLSDKLSSPQARKRNLIDPQGLGFFFRVAAVIDDTQQDWMTHAEPFYLLTEQAHSRRLSAPTVTPAYSNHTAHISWNADHNASYELQLRENRGGAAWETIAKALAGTQVHKKNLTSNNGYQFRVRPVVPCGDDDANTNGPYYSPPSEPHVALGLSPGLKRLFQQSHLEDGQLLLRKPKAFPAPLADVLGGKEFVLLYVSAHWCGPCRQFTPQLVSWYNGHGNHHDNPVEIVFLSADHDEHSFASYYASMPWAAVPYDDDGREGLMAYLQVQGIPRLAVVDARTGRIVEDNAVGTPLDIHRWRQLAAAAGGSK